MALAYAKRLAKPVMITNGRKLREANRSENQTRGRAHEEGAGQKAG